MVYVRLLERIITERPVREVRSCETRRLPQLCSPSLLWALQPRRLPRPRPQGPLRARRPEPQQVRPRPVRQVRPWEPQREPRWRSRRDGGRGHGSGLLALLRGCPGGRRRCLVWAYSTDAGDVTPGFSERSEFVHRRPGLGQCMLNSCVSSRAALVANSCRVLPVIVAFRVPFGEVAMRTLTSWPATAFAQSRTRS